MRPALVLPRLVASFAILSMRGSAALCVAAGSRRAASALRALRPAPAVPSSAAGVRRTAVRTAATTTTLRLFSSLSPSSGEGRTTEAPRDKEAQIVQNALFRIRDVNKAPPRGMTFLDFVVDGTKLGRVSSSNADLLVARGGGGGVFLRASGGSSGDGGALPCLTFSNQVEPTFDARTEAVASVTHRLRQAGHLPGWRDELYPISQSFYDDPVFAMERAAVPWLGALEYGVHVNGLVLGDDESNGGATAEAQMWMARRSQQKSKFPGMLDHIVAGGQPLGMSLLDNVIKECHEEAGISEDLARQGIRAASAISYETYVKSSQTLSRAVLFNYDLYLPSSFVPVPVDGEVDEFFLWTMDDLFEALDPNYPDPIKPNCYSGAYPFLSCCGCYVTAGSYPSSRVSQCAVPPFWYPRTVIIDYLVRHGHLSPDTPRYLDVVRELRSGDCR
jgi:8-oxo-dGTP pyrophosphatase MutT (NUDIX family)